VVQSFLNADALWSDRESPFSCSNTWASAVPDHVEVSKALWGYGNCDSYRCPGFGLVKIWRRKCAELSAGAEIAAAVT
jgi:hypothetical protein